MDFKNKLFDIHKFYNLSRYVFLNIEWNYNNLVKSTGITLPQLRVLWIIKIFQGISLGEIARIGCWAPPTVTKMLKILMEKNLVVREETSNKKLYTLNLTQKGHDIIKVNSLNKGDDFSIFHLIPVITKEDLAYLINIFKLIVTESKNTFIFEYIEQVNKLGLKINYSRFENEEKYLLQELVCFYNLLRNVILNIENNHRQMLASLNLTYPQLRALWVIDAFPGITSLKLSELTYLAPSTVNVIVKNLYEKKLIYKEKSQVKNSRFLYISENGEELLVKDFEVNQKSLLIYKDIEILSIDELVKVDKIILEMNMALKNDFVKEYIERTFTVIEKRLFNKN
ncbi:MAG: MarR family transcriptional regulator [Clostridiaceae bacterium]